MLAMAVYADAFTAVVYPVEVDQGEPFFVVVKNVSERPAVKFGPEWLPLTSCGDGCYLALGAADLKAKPRNYPIKVSEGTLSVSLALAVLDGGFTIQHLELPPDKVILSPENEARANKEAELLRSHWANINSKLWDGDFIMPLEGGISTAFGAIRIMNKIKTTRHSGLDIRGGYGTPILAANSGQVVVNDNLFFGGNTVVIDHGMGIYSVYMHLQESKVSEGVSVAKADVIGLVGSTGRSTGPHLHYTIKMAARNISPRALANLPLKKAMALGEKKPAIIEKTASGEPLR